LQPPRLYWIGHNGQQFRLAARFQANIVGRQNAFNDLALLIDLDGVNRGVLTR